MPSTVQIMQRQSSAAHTNNRPQSSHAGKPHGPRRRFFLRRQSAPRLAENLTHCLRGCPPSPRLKPQRRGEGGSSKDTQRTPLPQPPTPKHAACQRGLVRACSTQTQPAAAKYSAIPQHRGWRSAHGVPAPAPPAGYQANPPALSPAPARRGAPPASPALLLGRPWFAAARQPGRRHRPRVRPAEPGG